MDNKFESLHVKILLTIVMYLSCMIIYYSIQPNKRTLNNSVSFFNKSSKIVQFHNTSLYFSAIESLYTVKLLNVWTPEKLLQLSLNLNTVSLP